MPAPRTTPRPTNLTPFGRLTVSFLILTLLILAMAGPASGAERRCAACGKLITAGRYIQVGEQFYHPNHFLCAHCQKPITNLPALVLDGKFYDSTCYLEYVVPRCGYCNGPITDSFRIYEGKNYHDSCFYSHVAIRCALCGDTIMGHYLEDDFGNAYHSRHEKSVPRCDYCGRFLPLDTTGRSQVYGDGRRICGLCRSTAVDDVDLASHLLKEVQDSLAAIGIVVDRDKIPLKLIDSRQMAGVTNGERGDASGYTLFEKRTAAYGLITSRKFQVYALTGMPNLYLRTVLCHELMHVWLGLNAPLYQDKAMVEGSCNYAAYLYLQRLHGDDVDRQISRFMKDPDPLYGDGFRKTLAFTLSTGLAEWLEYLKHNTRSPW